MSFSMILAMDKNQGIGYKGNIPWHLPNDFKYFKEVTSNQVVIMGKSTYDSIGRPLPDRHNIVLTRDESFKDGKVTIKQSIVDTLSYLREEYVDDREHFVIGGATIYDQFLPYVDRIYVTWIDEEFETDTKVTSINWDEWSLVFKSKGFVDEKNKIPHTFCIYERKSE